MFKNSSRGIYAIIAAAHVAACLGIDPHMVSAMLAINYILLATNCK